jgi:hypothetical protein
MKFPFVSMEIHRENLCARIKQLDGHKGRFTAFFSPGQAKGVPGKVSLIEAHIVTEMLVGQGRKMPEKKSAERRGEKTL